LVSPDPKLGALVGAVLGGAYEVIRLLGEGGMGAVYEATHLRLNKRVAVKVMARELASNSEALARFRREAEVTSRLGHPHLVNVMDFGATESGEPYLVMEYLDGEDLDHRIRNLGRLPLETAVEITRQVASALAAAHDEGIVHRDLKPANIYLVKVKGEADFVKVLDFGISKIKASRTKLTRASAVMGTPEYMSPEQATGLIEEIDHRADQWALGCIAWEMLSGHAPFRADDMSALFFQVINMDPHPLSKRAPGLPAEVEPVLRRALAKQAGDRYPSIKDFARGFEAAATGYTRELTPPPLAISRSAPVKGTVAYSARLSSGKPRPSPQPGTIARAPTVPVHALASVDAFSDDLVEDEARRKKKRICVIAGAALAVVMLVVILWPRKVQVPESPRAPTTASKAPDVVVLPAPASTIQAVAPGSEPLPSHAPKTKASKTQPDDLGKSASGRGGPSYPNPFEMSPERGKSPVRKPPKTRPQREQLIEEL
jgi:serine/threonine protein kinase